MSVIGPKLFYDFSWEVKDFKPQELVITFDFSISDNIGLNEFKEEIRVSFLKPDFFKTIFFGQVLKTEFVQGTV